MCLRLADKILFKSQYHIRQIYKNLSIELQFDKDCIYISLLYTAFLLVLMSDFPQVFWEDNVPH